MSTARRVNYSMPESPFELPPELADLRDHVRSIVNSECIPLEAELLSNEPLEFESGPGEALLIDGALPAETWARLEKVSKDAGIWGAHLPEELGGLGMGNLGKFVMDEEIARSLVPLPLARIPDTLLGLEGAQREKYLEPALRGELSWSFAQTEPGGGSDPGGMRTKAVRDGDDWILSGQKMFISRAGWSDVYFVMALTDPEKRSHGGISMFAVDPSWAGVSTSPIKTWITPGRARQFTIFFDDVRVPGDAMIGAPGEGFAIGQKQLIISDRLTRGSAAAGILSRALEMAVDWAKNRNTFGAPLATRQAIQWMLIDVVLDIKAIRAVSYECAAKADQGLDVRVEGAMSKFMGGNWGHRSIDKIMQVFGAIAETTDHPVSHWYRVLRHARIGGGTDEIQRTLIARGIMRDGAKLWQA
jgi:acyl-CoA dehydrogenase